MKVFYVSSNVASIQMHLLEALDKAGAKTQLLTYTMHVSAPVPTCPSGSIVYKCNSFERGPVLYLARLSKIANYIAPQINVATNDIFHGNMLFCDGIICRRLVKKTGNRYVVSVRNTDLNLKFLWHLPWIKKAGINVIKDASRILFLSETYREQLLERLPNHIKELVMSKSEVIPNGIDDFWLDNQFKGERVLSHLIRVLTIGKIEKNKNQIAVAQAINLLRKEINLDIRYDIIGDSKDESLCKELNQYDFVTIKPFMQKEELIGEMRNADIYAMPSHTETFGLVYAEALSQKLPIVYTAKQGFDGQYPDGLVGHAVNSKDVDSIKNALNDIIAHYDDICANTKNDIERYRWSTIAGQLIDNYKTKGE